MYHTRQQAKAKLTEMGYRYNSALYVWELPNGEGGALEWTPDYSKPNDVDRGKDFHLRSHTGTITPIPLEEA